MDFQILSKKLENKFKQFSIESKEKKIKIEKEIERLLEKIPLANNELVKYINKRIIKLNLEKENIEENFLISRKKNLKNFFVKDKDYILLWEKMSIEDKIAVVDAFIKNIRVFESGMEIIWKI